MTTLTEYVGVCVLFDIIVFETLYSSYLELAARLTKVFKSFVFQKEKGHDNDYIYW